MKRLLLLSVIAAACSGGDSRPVDSALERDLALASQMQAAQQQFQDTASGPAPTAQRAPARIDNAPRTRVTPRQPAPRTDEMESASRAVIGAGSSFSLASQQRICTSSNRPGDRFVATLTNPVTGTNGAVIPAGSSVILEVVAVSPGTSNGSDASVRLAVHSVEFNGRSYPLTGEVYTSTDLERTRIMSDPNADKKKVIGGAVAGAILGRVLGKSTKGTVIGAAAGGAAGAAAAKATQNFEACLPVGGGMRLTLSEAVIL
ncbi:MAG: glycine zipper 2TM domain-containing protein [Gemmatimonadaceae bacterium]